MSSKEELKDNTIDDVKETDLKKIDKKETDENKIDNQSVEKELSENENWGDFGLSQKIQSESLVPFADDVEEMPRVETQEIGGSSDMHGQGYERYDRRGPPRRDGLRGFDRQNDRFPRHFERRNGFNRDEPPKRRAYEDRRPGPQDNGRFGMERRENDRFGGRGNDRFQDRRDDRFSERREFDRFSDRRGGSERDFNSQNGGRFGDSSGRSGNFERSEFRGDDRRDNFLGRSGERFERREFPRGSFSERGSFSRQAPPSKSLRIFGIPLDAIETDFQEWITQHCEDVRYANYNFVKDRSTGSFRGFAFINFETVEDASSAKDRLYNTEILNQRVKVDFANSDGPRGPPRS